VSEILDYIGTWSVLKWIVLVLVAGFIGQFGRMTAEAVTAHVRLRREKRKTLKVKPISAVKASEMMPDKLIQPVDAPVIQSAELVSPTEAHEAGLAKSIESPKAAFDEIVQPKAADVAADKKALKAAEKIRKKAGKAAIKAAKK